MDNTSAAIKVVTTHREQEFRLFDDLPRAIRDCINYSALPYAVREVAAAWDGYRQTNFMPTIGEFVEIFKQVEQHDLSQLTNDRRSQVY